MDSYEMIIANKIFGGEKSADGSDGTVSRPFVEELDLEIQVSEVTIE